jgi:hypothetical protein
MYVGRENERMVDETKYRRKEERTNITQWDGVVTTRWPLLVPGLLLSPAAAKETCPAIRRAEQRLPSLFVVFRYRKEKKDKAIPVTSREGPHGCETSRLPQFLDNRLTDGGKIVSLTRRPPFTPKKTPGTHFC